MSIIDHKLWVEKYRPKSIDDCILSKATKREFLSFIEKGSIPNLLLAGPAGTGKTTAALALCNQLGYETLMINGSNEGRLIDTVRTKITQFGSSMSLEGKRKCVIVDEADGMPNDPQLALRNLIEELSSNCSFILTCNFPNRLIPAIHSRSAVVDFAVQNSEKQGMIVNLYKRVSEILKTEGVVFDKEVLGAMVTKFFPDMRRLLNELQRRGTSGDINTGSLIESDGEIPTLVGFLKEKDFKQTRKWVAATPNIDLQTICRELYDKIYELVQPADMPQLIITMAEYQYKSNFVADAEINTMAMLTEIMMGVNFK